MMVKRDLKADFEDLDDATHKHDEDKPQLHLVPPGLIEAVGVIRTYGTKKYGDPEGWKRVEPERYTSALMRHLCEFLRDPHSCDAESGYPHLWHLACNVAFLIEMATPHPCLVRRKDVEEGF